MEDLVPFSGVVWFEHIISRGTYFAHVLAGAIRSFLFGFLRVSTICILYICDGNCRVFFIRHSGFFEWVSIG
jgi:hypothetical protein